MGTPCTAYKLYLMITIPSTEIVCLRLSESYVATQSDIAAYWCSNYLKDCNGVQLSLFRTVVLQPGFVIKDIANSFFPLSQDRFYINRPRFGYGTLAGKLFSGGSRGSPIYRKNGDLGAPFSQGSPQLQSNSIFFQKQELLTTLLVQKTHLEVSGLELYAPSLQLGQPKHG